MLLLDHVGAKSGTERTSPLLYIRDGDDLVVVASKGGFPKNPAWFYNLKANPDTTVQVASQPPRGPRPRGQARGARAPLAAGVKAYHGYEDYAARSKGREIPLVILEPRK